MQPCYSQLVSSCLQVSSLAYSCVLGAFFACCCCCCFFALQLELVSENSRRLWLFPGSVRGFSGKTPGKSWENCWKIFPESQNATNSRISGTGKGKPAGNLGSTLPGPCPHLPCGVLCWNRQFQPSRVFLMIAYNGKVRNKHLNSNRNPASKNPSPSTSIAFAIASELSRKRTSIRKEFPKRGRKFAISSAKNSHSLTVTFNSQFWVWDLGAKVR